MPKFRTWASKLSVGHFRLRVKFKKLGLKRRRAKGDWPKKVKFWLREKIKIIKSEIKSAFKGKILAGPKNF
jgi:hypothetical protein